MKNQSFLPVLILGIAVCTAALADVNESIAQAEPWKGEPSERRFTLSAMTGAGSVYGYVGPTVMAAGAVKVMHQGFVPEINNQVYAETEIGPLFVQGATVAVYSMHMRWDFHLNDQWAFFALGGLGGNIAGSAFGNTFRVFPRLGVGTLLSVSDVVSLRAELSQELLLVGVAFPL